VSRKGVSDSPRHYDAAARTQCGCRCVSFPSERLGMASENAEPRLAADGSVTEVVCSFTDITERKRAEEELRAREERFRNAFAHAATGMA